jgi:hypothetical protein
MPGATATLTAHAAAPQSAKRKPGFEIRVPGVLG